MAAKQEPKAGTLNVRNHPEPCPFSGERYHNSKIYRREILTTNEKSWSGGRIRSFDESNDGLAEQFFEPRLNQIRLVVEPGFCSGD